MKPGHRTVFALLAMACAASAWTAPSDTDRKPADRPAAGSAHQGHGAHTAHRTKRIPLENAEGANVTLWKPDLSTAPLTAHDGRVDLNPTGLDSYHAVVAERERAGVKETVIRYEYLNGRRTGRSPAELTAVAKTDFEIVPDPLPREHARYLTANPAAFLVRYRGAPLAGATVTLDTSHGSALEAVTGADGRVRFRLPDDFPEVKPGRANNPAAELRISSTHRAGDRTYRTVLTAAYHVDPAHWQSFEGGLLIAAAGIVAGGITGRRLLAAGPAPAHRS